MNLRNSALRFLQSNDRMNTVQSLSIEITLVLIYIHATALNSFCQEIMPVSRFGELPSESPRTAYSVSNNAWVVYDCSSGDIYAQPKGVPYPLFISIKISLGSLFRPRPTRDPDRHNFKFGRTVNCEVENKHLPKPKVNKLVIILHILTTWSQGFVNFQQVYSALPFHSDISIRDYGTGTDTFSCDFPPEWGLRVVNADFNVGFFVDRYFESQIRTPIALRKLWGVTAGFSNDSLGVLHADTDIVMPPVIAVTSLALEGWLQDTVNLVSIPGSENPEVLYAFKTNARAYRIYQEIETLLSLPPHENIHRPSHLVTKEAPYSLCNPPDPYILEPSEPVIGFLTPFHSPGSLRNVINARHTAGTLTNEDQLKWAQQLVSAVLHVFEHENGADKTRCGIYTNLKMANIIVTSPENGSDLVLIDFDRGFGNNWSHYSAPEIDCRMPAVRSKKTASSRTLGGHSSIYGYISSPADYIDENNFWTEASNAERESAMVWSLGCCLWCILEGKGCIVDVLSRCVPISIRSPYDCRWPTAVLGCPWDQAIELYGIPDEILEIVAMCIEKEPEERPTLREISDVLMVGRHSWGIELVSNSE